ncbi:MAG: lytic transglycosylase domain-containing protein [Acidobacteria bacterium]|nr:lytic transglycosylase domain-containing protein [Acidobacteriota bacterium]
MKIDRHERAGSMIRLYTSADGYIELPASSVVTIDPEDYVPLPPSKPESAAAAPLIQEPVQQPRKQIDPKELVEQAAVNNGLPPSFLHLVARQESGYRQDAVSSKGAIGIMQLMPGTAAALDADPHDPAQNVEAGARLLRDLLVQYQGYPDQVRRALAAYNAGPGAVQRFNGVPPYAETQNYVNRIVEAYRKTLPPAPAARN